MNKKAIKQIRECINGAFLVDQTVLVDTFLKGDKLMRYYNPIQNQYTFTAELSGGLFEGSNFQVDRKFEALHKQIASLQKMIEEAHEFLAIDNIKEEINLLERDIETLAAAKAVKKEIYYWFLIPYWLALVLIQEGETVLQISANNWWGVSQLESFGFKI